MELKKPMRLLLPVLMEKRFSMYFWELLVNYALA
jgi:hypothetical protein